MENLARHLKEVVQRFENAHPQDFKLSSYSEMQDLFVQDLEQCIKRFYKRNSKISIAGNPMEELSIPLFKSQWAIIQTLISERVLFIERVNQYVKDQNIFSSEIIDQQSLVKTIEVSEINNIIEYNLSK